MTKNLDNEYESLRNSTVNFDTSDKEDFYSVVDKFACLAIDNHVNSMRYIGHLFSMDTPFRSEKKSSRWYMMDIAKEYEKGLVYKKDLSKALHFYQMAYDNGECELSSKIDELEQKLRNNKSIEK